MGVTIKSKNYSINLGYHGFHALRAKVAELAADDIGEHYRSHRGASWQHSDKYFEEYDKKTEELSEKYHGEKDLILDFLYTSDCGGRMDTEHCKAIYEIIKDYDDRVLYGYAGQPGCVRFKDFKAVVKDCVDNGCAMEWF